MNKNTLAVLAVIVALLAGWMVMKNLNAENSSYDNQLDKTEELTGSGSTSNPTNDNTKSDASNLNAEVEVKGPNMKASVNVK